MLPGYGFFTLGQELRQTKSGEDDVAFAVRQIRRVHDHWAASEDRTSLTELLERARSEEQRFELVLEDPSGAPPVIAGSIDRMDRLQSGAIEVTS
jgi:hypothetical protein